MGELGSPGTRLFMGRPNTLGNIGAMGYSRQPYPTYPPQDIEPPSAPFTPSAPPSITPYEAGTGRYEELNQRPPPPPADSGYGQMFADFLANFRPKPVSAQPAAQPFAFTGRPVTLATLGGGQRGVQNLQNLQRQFPGYG